VVAAGISYLHATWAQHARCALLAFGYGGELSDATGVVPFQSMITLRVRSSGDSHQPSGQ
jgi:hypothetical protein